MSMMRLFVGLEPSPDFRDALRALQERLRAAGIDGRYAGPSNLHLTLAFVGMWPENIGHLLPAVGEPFPIALSHVGVFPKARVLWAGVKPSAALDALAERVRRTLDEAGVPYDRQPFYPHITLARKPIVPDALSLAEVAVPPAVMTVRNVCLYRSDRGEDGMQYTVIGRGARAPEP